MFDRKNRFWLVGMCLIGCLAFGSVSASAATTSKNRPLKTTVHGSVQEVEESLFNPGVLPLFTTYEYEASVNEDVNRKWSKQRKKRFKKCRKGRIVVFFHDENGNGKFDKGEFKIGAAKTDKRGVASFESGTIPPSGDRIGFWVKRGGGCKGRQHSIPIPDYL
jgi:hypothetical protein